MNKDDQILELQHEVSNLKIAISQQMKYIESLREACDSHDTKLEVIEELLELDEDNEY